MRFPICGLFLCLTLSSLFCLAGEEDTTGINKKRLSIVLAGSGIVYGASVIALNQAWYKQQQTSFHFFNDNSEWNQVDKAGHFYSAYQLSRVGKELFLWTNMTDKQSAIWGTVMSQVFMATIDVFDGHSAEYGFSWAISPPICWAADFSWVRSFFHTNKK
jgi:uncharacterized protein YfiM (DUF2279 family)